MASARSQRLLATLFSILGHAAIVAALTFSIPLSTSRPVQPDAVMINTTMIDERAVEAEMARIEEERESEIRRQQELVRRAEEERERQQELARQAEVERQRQVELARQAEVERGRQQELAREAEAERVRQIEIARQEELAREAEAERARQAEIERQDELARQAEAERARQAEIARQEELERQAEAERARQADIARQERIARIEAETLKAAEEENARRAAEQAGLLDQWILAITDKIERFWIRPPNATDELNCVLLVNLIPSGEVTDVSMQECNVADATIVRSIENAVLQASPLPAPPDPSLFDRNLYVRFQPGFRPDE